MKAEVTNRSTVAKIFQVKSTIGRFWKVIPIFKSYYPSLDQTIERAWEIKWPSISVSSSTLSFGQMSKLISDELEDLPSPQVIIHEKLKCVMVPLTPEKEPEEGTLLNEQQKYLVSVPESELNEAIEYIGCLPYYALLLPLDRIPTIWKHMGDFITKVPGRLLMLAHSHLRELEKFWSENNPPTEETIRALTDATTLRFGGGFVNLDPTLRPPE